MVIVSKQFKPKERWKYFREITSDKWIRAFIDKIKDEPGQSDFIYYIAITKLNGSLKDKKEFENSKIIKARFKKNKSNIELRIITLEEIITYYSRRIEEKKTNFLEATDVGRLLQLISAAKLKIHRVDKICQKKFVLLQF